MRNEGGGFAVNSNGAMLACIIQTPNLKLEPRTPKFESRDEWLGIRSFE